MKRFITLLLLIPLFLNAQTDIQRNYLAGAVPEVNGKVVITRELNANNFSKEQIYTALLDWCSTKFTGEGEAVVYKNGEDGKIAVITKDQFRVKIGLLPSIVNIQYMFTMHCSDNKCTLEFSRIRYTNNPFSKNSTDVAPAEEYITDKYALDKTKTKIFKGTGDYRKRTIDIIDVTTEEAQKALYDKTITANTLPVQQPVSEPALQLAEQVQTAEQMQAAQRSMQPVTAVGTASMKEIMPSEIPASIIQAASVNGVSIIAVDGRPLSKAIAGKGGFDINSGKAAAAFSVTENVDNIIYLLEKTENYTLAYIGEGNDILLIVDCKKSQQFNNMFIGEIVNVKIKK